MKKYILTLAAAAALAGAYAYIAWPIGHIPYYDAHLTRLAETPLQGYCAGLTFWQTSGMGSDWQARDCRAKYSHPTKHKKALRDDYVSLRIAAQQFCHGIIDAGWVGGVPSCMSILTGNQYWPTYNGGLTWAWSEARPYPLKDKSLGGL